MFFLFVRDREAVSEFQANLFLFCVSLPQVIYFTEVQDLKSMTVAILLILAFLTTVIGVDLFKRIASRSDRLLDIPNERSSHETPVTRGAGIAIVMTVLGLYVAFWGRDANFTFVAVAALVALVGFLDDLFSLPLLPRLAVHFVAAAVLAYSSGPVDQIRIPMSTTDLYVGPLGGIVLILFIVWTTNAFNFMDGIDGIAGSQGAAAGFGWMLFGLVSGEMIFAVLGALILGACVGFLVFNWQPATIFMGDVGSTFLGFTLASIPLIMRSETSIRTVDSLMLAGAFLWLFLFDTIYTRAKLFLTGKAFWQPHREHLFHNLVIGGMSHRAVALYYGIAGLLISSTSALRAEIGNSWSLILIGTTPILLLLLVQKKRLT